MDFKREAPANLVGASSLRAGLIRGCATLAAALDQAGQPKSNLLEVLTYDDRVAAATVMVGHTPTRGRPHHHEHSRNWMESEAI